MLKQNKIAKDTTIFLSSTVFSSILNVFRGVFVARILGPTLFGFWNIFMLVFRYNSLADVGLISGMFKLIPIHRGSNELETAEKIKNIAFWANTFVYVSLNVFLFTSTFYLSFIAQHFKPLSLYLNCFPLELVWGLRILALINLSSQFYIFYTALLRADKNFVFESISNGLIAISSLILLFLFVLIVKNKLIAALLSLFFAYSIANLYLLSKTNYHFPYLCENKLLFSVFKAGFPIFLVNITYVFLISIDRWMIAKYFGPTQVGLYGIGISMISFMGLLPTALASTLFPHMLEKFGQSKDPASFSNIVYMPTKVNTLIMFYVCGFMAIIMPVFIHFVVPKYVEGIQSAVILSIAIYFLSLNTITGNFLISIDKQRYVIYIQGICILLSTSIYYFLIKSGLGITGVALGTLLTYFIYSFMILGLSMRYISKSTTELWKKMFSLHLPFIALSVIIGLFYLLSNNFLFFLSIYVKSGLMLIAFTIVSIPVFIEINKHTQILALIQTNLFNRIK